MHEGRIFRDKEAEHIYHDLLRSHFPSVETFEKYPDAAFNMMLTSICNKVLGKNFAKERVSQRKAKKINAMVLTRLEQKYGRWITFTNFKIKRHLSLFYKTNLHLCFRVKDLGILYGCDPHTISGNIFFTSHALQRFEERADAVYLLPLHERLRAVFKAHPTSYDLLNFLIKASNQQYGRKDNYCYLNVVVGYLVLEDLGDVFIAKTFYSNEMVKDKLKWYQGDINIDNADSFANLLHSPTEPIDEPTFIQDELSDLLGDVLMDILEEIE